MRSRRRRRNGYNEGGVRIKGGEKKEEGGSRRGRRECVFYP